MSAQTILVVDDDPDQHRLCALLLEHAGYRVLHANDGVEGVALARAEQPDLVMMDIRMARMDGVSARRELAADPATQGIPVVAVTADLMQWPPARLLDEGFVAYLAKPCDLRRLLRVVQGVLAGTPDAPGAPVPA
ncbi:MAG TPA: response regulator [Longimicrobium sp.]|nr:response regulator [Longimicrobium sp.]